MKFFYAIKRICLVSRLDCVSDKCDGVFPIISICNSKEKHLHGIVAYHKSADGIRNQDSIPSDLRLA